MEVDAVGGSLTDDDVVEKLAHIKAEAARQESEAQQKFGSLEGSDPTIAPLRRALAAWGLTIDDIGVASVSALYKFGIAI